MNGEHAVKRPAILGGPPAFLEPLPFARPFTPPLADVVCRLEPSYERGMLTNGSLVEDQAARRLGMDHVVAWNGLRPVFRVRPVLVPGRHRPPRRAGPRRRSHSRHPRVRGAVRHRAPGIAGRSAGIPLVFDAALAERLRTARDYGNPGDYDTRFVGLNGRMSELHAAVALASLDLLDETDAVAVT